jgi:hypothetical protein
VHNERLLKHERREINMKRFIVYGCKDTDITDRLSQLGSVEKLSEIYNIYLLVSDCELGEILELRDVTSTRIEDQAFIDALNKIKTRIKENV